MRKKIVGMIVCTLLMATAIQITGTTKFDVEEQVHLMETTSESVIIMPAAEPAKAVPGDDPEVIDDEGDTIFNYIDVLWASFYENPAEPEYLYIALKIANLEDKIGCVYAVHWYYDGVHYDTTFRNGILIPRMDFKSWRCDFYILRTPIDTWNESYNSGFFDLETGVITWKIHKSCIGIPQPGDVLTRSYVFTAQRISKLGLIPLKRLFRSFSDSTDPLESIDYIVQY